MGWMWPCDVAIRARLAALFFSFYLFFVFVNDSSYLQYTTTYNSLLHHNLFERRWSSEYLCCWNVLVIRNYKSFDFKELNWCRESDLIRCVSGLAFWRGKKYFCQDSGNETVAVHRRLCLQHLRVAALTQAVRPDTGSESRFLPAHLHSTPPLGAGGSRRNIAMPFGTEN